MNKEDMQEIVEQEAAFDRLADLKDAEILSKAPNASVFNVNLQSLPFELSTLNNIDLLSNFKRIFTHLNDYIPKNEVEKTHIFETGRIFKEEFVYRLNSYSNIALVEFAALMKDLMKKDKTLGATFYTRTLLRLYSVALNIMKQRGMVGKEIRKEFM